MEADNAATQALEDAKAENEAMRREMAEMKVLDWIKLMLLLVSIESLLPKKRLTWQLRLPQECHD